MRIVLRNIESSLRTTRFSSVGGERVEMLTLHFCLDGSPSILRYWASVPRIGDTISLPELGGNLNLLRVYDVIWEGAMEPTVSVYVHHAKVDHALCNETPRNFHQNGVVSERIH